MPVYEMLGGACRDKLKVYCWIGGDRPNDIRRQALEKYEQGYRAVKMNATEEMHYIDTFDKVEAVVERGGHPRGTGYEDGYRSGFPRQST